ncbi:PREDICTED: methenyltetrahydrofolate synthase domain-containing protein isoform X3 [Myotis davidii]|uniref:methenyltetrahydrofolate synthase domain-containing protein isoform X3 n=1 Tax=Myotis davidii TaxID=225400 RepID=UPI000767D319|nr:PREDICTED: methenyltetrahydrofolate synthase domain-containing protein isoform X3 [Myotis davidii]
MVKGFPSVLKLTGTGAEFICSVSVSSWSWRASSEWEILTAAPCVCYGAAASWTRWARACCEAWCSAVRAGWRIGKGEGYADLEYAMMASMGAVSQGTPVVTIVHDCQVVDIPEALLEDHDLTVDYILTPTRVITTGCERPKPTGITWSKISSAMMGRIPILRSLRSREKQAGRDVTLKNEHPPREARSQHAAPPGAVRRPGDPAQPEACSPQGEDVPSDTVYVGNLPRDTRVSELKRALRERGAAPLRLTWQGPQHRAFLHFQDPAAAQQALSRLQGLHLGANTLKVALAQQQRASDLAGGHAREPHPDH